MRFAVFLLFPALELYLLVKVGAETGALNMVLWVFVSAAIGLWAVRAQGQEAMNRARADIAAGRVPQNNFLDGLLLFLGGVLLILPGLISDAVGLLLLAPVFRHWAARGLARYLGSRQARPQDAGRIFFFSSSAPGGPPFADGPFAPHGRADGHRDEAAGPDRAADAGPRQAVIIESTAIEINATKTDGQGANHESGKPQ